MDNIIPINRAIIHKLKSALSSIEQWCCTVRDIDAIFITFEGFMKSENIRWDGRDIYQIPKINPVLIAFQDNVPVDFRIERMTFMLDRLQTTSALAIFRQVE